MNFTRNSSTSSSDADWRKFFRTFAGTVAACLIAGYAFILIIDPFDALPFSPDLERTQVGGSQRFYFPSLARKPEFDSAIIGTSNVRLLKPAQLNPAFDSTFVNLAMNAASAIEQERIFEVFRRHHPTPKTVVFGMDYVWCYEKEFRELIGGVRPWNVPQWLFDENPYNDLPPLNAFVFEQAWQQFLHVTGLKPSRFGRDGYTDFTRDMGAYDLRRARLKIYDSPQPLPKKPVVPSIEATPALLASFRYPALPLLEKMLQSLPETTVKILIFVPYHHYFQPPPGSRLELLWRECKRQATDIARKYANSHVLDFMIESPITTRDQNYWDAKHYTVEVAERLGELIVQGVRTDTESRIFVRLSELHPGL